MLRLAHLSPLRHRPSLARASHIGAAPIPIPPGLEVLLAPGNAALTISGLRGSISVPFLPFVSLSHPPYAPSASSKSPPYRTSTSGLSQPNPAPMSTPKRALELAVRSPENTAQRATWDLAHALVANAVTRTA
ncbi:hypothetical protein FRC07_009154 [Ceratobasidium sp. 392]|nr:hypothetical protein FRC07_009154 [Ceratobasidium sp. 392]